MSDLRRSKIGYNDELIDTTPSLSSEELVRLDDYGIANQAFYSRPNNSTGEPIEGVRPDLWVRRSVAETLQQINMALPNQIFTDLFGSTVELYVEDAWRDPELQTELYNIHFPQLLRNSGLSEEQVMKRRSDLIALPSTDPLRPSPHVTGAAVDITLRQVSSSRRFVEGLTIDFGSADNDISRRCDPDYYETAELTSADDRRAQRTRRAWYAVMTGAAFGMPTHMTVNPTEYWHWSRGDQLWARVTGKRAYYSIMEKPSA